MHGFHDSGLEKGWWWLVWRAGFGDSSPEKQAIHPKGASFRESSLENGMLPYLGKCSHDSSLQKFGMYGFHVSGLEMGWWWVVWKGGFRDSSPES